MFDNDLSPETREQLDAIYEVVAKYDFNTKEEFKREFAGMHPDKFGGIIGNWQLLADAYLLFRKRYTDGQELESADAIPILNALSGLMTISPTAAADDIDDALIDFDELPEDVGRQVLSCLLKVSEDRKGGQKNENPDWPEEVVDRIWVDHHLAILESLRSSGRRDSGRRKKRRGRARRK